jgi:hypothetical protein
MADYDQREHQRGSISDYSQRKAMRWKLALAQADSGISWRMAITNFSPDTEVGRALLRRLWGGILLYVVQDLHALANAGRGFVQSALCCAAVLRGTDSNAVFARRYLRPCSAIMQGMFRSPISAVDVDAAYTGAPR